MSDQNRSNNAKGNVKLRFRPIQHVKLFVERDRLTITVRGKGIDFGKYVDAILEAGEIGPLNAQVMAVVNNDLIPANAPIAKLASVLSELVGSLGRSDGYRVETRTVALGDTELTDE
jgi:hypothetical protein